MKEKEARKCGIEKISEEELKEIEKQNNFEVTWNSEKKTDKNKEN